MVRLDGRVAALTFDGAVADVFAKLHALEPNTVEGFISATLGEFNCVAKCSDAKHAPAVGDHFAVLPGCASVKNFGIVGCGG
jgi:hypothetical protein